MQAKIISMAVFDERCTDSDDVVAVSPSRLRCVWEAVVILGRSVAVVRRCFTHNLIKSAFRPESPWSILRTRCFTGYRHPSANPPRPCASANPPIQSKIENQKSKIKSGA